MLRLAEKTIGMVSYVARDNEEEAYLMNIIMRPEFRGRGYGEAMVREAVRICLDEMKKKRVELETSNPLASRLYQRAGFIVQHSFHNWNLKA